jgi:Cu-processing system permease protein
MKPIFVIAFNTFREILRDKILYGFLIFAVFFIFISLALGQLSYAEQVRITQSFGTSAMQLSAVFLSILLGCMLLPREIEKKTILTILVRPLTRWQFLLGKTLGLFGMISVVGVGLACIMALVMMLAGAQGLENLIPVVVGVLLESLVMLGATLLLSTFSRPILVSCMSIGIFMIGHWQSTLSQLTQSSDSTPILAVKWLTEFFMPDLEVFNWKGLLIYQDTLNYETIIFAFIYGVGWFMVFMLIAAFGFEREELG